MATSCSVTVTVTSKHKREYRIAVAGNSRRRIIAAVVNLCAMAGFRLAEEKNRRSSLISFGAVTANTSGNSKKGPYFLGSVKTRDLNFA